MKKKDFKAINVTIPYKQDVIPYLSSIDEHAKAIGAVNTIVNDNGRLKGYNTDFSGFIYMIHKHNICMKVKKCLVLGNGGAAKAIIAALKYEQAKEIIIVDIITGNGAISYEECFREHTDAEIIVNTSPVGMYPKVNAQPVDLMHFPKCKAVVDVIYNPLETQLTKQGRELGMTSITGLEMLVAQAKYAVEIFLNQSIEDAKIQEIYEELKKQ